MTIAAMLLLMLPLVGVAGLVVALAAMNVAQDNAADLVAELETQFGVEFRGDEFPGFSESFGADAIVDSMLSAMWLQVALISTVRLIQAVGFGILAFAVLRGSHAGRIITFVLAGMLSFGAVCLGVLDGVRQSLRRQVDRMGEDLGFGFVYEDDLLPGWYHPLNWVVIVASVVLILAVVWLLTRPDANEYFRRSRPHPRPPYAGQPPPGAALSGPQSGPPSHGTAPQAAPVPGPAPVLTRTGPHRLTMLLGFLTRVRERLTHGEQQADLAPTDDEEKGPDPGPGPSTPASEPADELPQPTPARRGDPIAVALGNATLLGVGYLLLRRWWAAVGTMLTSTVLVLVLAGFGQPGWFWRVVLFLWWFATIGHGWVAAQPPAPDPDGAAARPAWQPWRHRAAAATVAVALVAGAVAIALDARRIEAAAADAHRSGDCVTATGTVERIGARHRVVDPYVTRRAEVSVEACGLLLAGLADAQTHPEAAARTLTQYVDHPSALWPDASELRTDLLLVAADAQLGESLTGRQTEALADGFRLLADVLALAPTRADDVDEALTGYLDQLPDIDPCDAMAHIDWVRDREPSGDVLDRAGDEADALAPPVFLDCGDQLLETAPPRARNVYQTVLDRYPDHGAARAARQGIDEADALIEEEQVRRLFTGASRTRYCEEPAAYRGAPRYQGPGPHLIVVETGTDPLRRAILPEWRAEDFTEATLVLCGSNSDLGSVLGTCHYQGGITVTLRAHRLEVRGYELHTGELAFELEVEMGSSDCPPSLTTYEGYDPPTYIFADPTLEPIRAVLQPWALP